MVQLLWKTVWQLLEKLHKKLPYDAALSLSDIYQKEMKTRT